MPGIGPPPPKHRIGTATHATATGSNAPVAAHARPRSAPPLFLIWIHANTLTTAPASSARTATTGIPVNASVFVAEGPAVPSDLAIATPAAMATTPAAPRIAPATASELR